MTALVNTEEKSLGSGVQSNDFCLKNIPIVLGDARTPSCLVPSIVAPILVPTDVETLRLPLVYDNKTPRDPIGVQVQTYDMVGQSEEAPETA